MPASRDTARRGDALAQALELARRHVPGVGDPEVSWLQSGVSNSSYAVVRDGCRFALRVAQSGGIPMGVDREWERRVLQQVQRARLSPVVEICLPADGVLVTCWVEGASWSAGEAAAADKVGVIAALIRKIHGVRSPVLARTMNPVRWIALYRKALAPFLAAGIAAVESPALLARARQQLQVYERFGPRPGVLCHSDLHRHNLIQCGNDLIILDWEYAHVGDAFWDLAGWLSMNDLSGVSADTLLAAYLTRSPLEEERQRLQVLRWFFDYVGLLWISLCGAVLGAHAPPDLAERTQVLLARLHS